MPVIVKHIKSGKYYILLGASYSFFKDSRPGVFGGSLFPHEEQGEFKLAALCNEQGKIGWLPTRELEVTDVDGTCPIKLLKSYYSQDMSNIDQPEDESCPGCGAKLKVFVEECPECGLRLIALDEEQDTP